MVDKAKFVKNFMAVRAAHNKVGELVVPHLNVTSFYNDRLNCSLDIKPEM